MKRTISLDDIYSDWVCPECGLSYKGVTVAGEIDSGTPTCRYCDVTMEMFSPPYITKSLLDPEDFGSVLRWAYCMDYDIFLDVMGWESDYYAKDKHRRMSEKFTSFYCEMEGKEQRRFINAWRNSHGSQDNFCERQR